MLTVDYDRLDLRPGMTVLDLGLRRGPARLRGLPARRVGRRPRLGQSPRSRRRSAGWARSPRPARRRPAPRYEVVRGDLLALPVPRRQRRPGHRLGGARAHPGRRHRDGRDRPRAQARRPGRGHRAALRARADLLGAVRRVPRQRGRPHPHLHGAASVRTRLAVGRAWRPAAATTPTRCTRRTGGSSAPSAWSATPRVVRAYHRLLVWDLTKRPWLTRTAERVLDPLFGKSLVVYADKPARPPAGLRRLGRRRRPDGVGADRCRALTRPAAPRAARGPRPRTSCARRSRGSPPQQDADGALPWFRGGQLDPWDSVEAAMALDVGGEHDRAPRGLPLAGRPAARGRLVGRASTATARRPRRPPRATTPGYLAVGAWHSWLLTGDERAGRPSCGRRSARGLDLVTRMQLPGGAIGWALRPDGTADDTALLTGNASLFQALRCGIALAGLHGRGRSRTGSWRSPTSGRRCAPGPRRSPTGRATRWTGTTRCSAARSPARPPATGWPPTGTGSSSPAWAPAASPTGRG